MSADDAVTHTLRAACVQMARRESVDAALAAAAGHIADAAARGAGMVLLPEYHFLPAGEHASFKDLAAHAGDVKRALADASREAGVLVAGNVLEEREGVVQNTLLAYDAGAPVGAQPKIHPMPGEAEFGVSGGDAFTPFNAGGVRYGGLVCADIFYPEAARVLSLKGAEVILNPVMSPYHDVDPTKAAREAVFVARAWDAGAFVLKAGCFTTTEPRAVGRSLITAPWGVLAHYEAEFEEEILVADLDLARVRAFRAQHRGFQSRFPKAYADLLGEPE